MPKGKGQGATGHQLKAETNSKNAEYRKENLTCQRRVVSERAGEDGKRREGNAK